VVKLRVTIKGFIAKNFEDCDFMEFTKTYDGKGCGKTKSQTSTNLGMG
jgi:hypothetical protein